jgi:predicted ATPase
VLAAVVSVDEPTLQAELAKLVQADILHSKGALPRCIYIFKYALLEDALYNALVRSKRQQFHAGIAATPGTVSADHGNAAGTFGPPLDGGGPDRACDRLLAQGRAAVAAASGGPRSDRQQFGIMLGQWEWHLVRGDLEPSVGLAAHGMTLAARRNDPGMLMEARFMRGATMFYRGQFADARVCYEQAVAAYDDREQTRFWATHTGHNAGVTHRCYLALVLWHLGYPDEAVKVDRETRGLARTIGHAFSTGHAVDVTAFLGHYCRLGAQVRVAAEEELALATDQGLPLWHALWTLHKGAGMLLECRREEALQLLLEGFEAFRSTGAEVRVPSYLGMLGDAYTQTGRFDDAHKALNEGLEVVEKNDDRCHQAELHRLEGELLLAESPDQMAAAEDCFRQAIETALRQQSKGWELRATLSLARL